MKRLLLFFVPALFTAAAAQAQQQDQQAAMKAWQEYMTPGKVHEMMAKSDGKWTYEMTMWMAPDAPPTKSSGTTENKMVLGGRYQESVHKGNIENMPFEGHGLMAYDNAKKIFQSSWVDNMGTGIMTLEGPWDDATKSLTLMGKSYDCIKKKEIGVKEVVTMVDDNHQKMEMYMVDEGKEMKTMEINLTRK